MRKITPVNPYDLIKLLSKVGFKPVRQRGSHVILINDRGVRIVVPVHPGRKVKPGLIRVILAEAGISREEYFELLERDC